MSRLIERPQRSKDIVLRLTLIVGSEGVTLNHDDGLATLDVERHELVRCFQETGHELREGTFRFQINSDGINFIDDASVYSQDDWKAIIGDGSALATILMSHFNMLITAYRGMVLEDEQLNAIVRAAVKQAMLVDEDPLRKEFRLPTIDQLAGAIFKSGCVDCHFDDPFARFMVNFNRGDGTKPQLAKGVVQIVGVNIRILEKDRGLLIIVGYLDHKNPFMEAFHGDLIARLQPMLTPDFVRSVIQDHLTTLEVGRRVIVREGFAIAEDYGFNQEIIASLADMKERDIRVELRHQREMSVDRFWGALRQFFGS